MHQLVQETNTVLARYQQVDEAIRHRANRLIAQTMLGDVVGHTPDRRCHEVQYELRRLCQKIRLIDARSNLTFLATMRHQ